MSALLAFRRIHGEPIWDDLITGYDFGFLNPAAIQACSFGESAAVLRLRTLTGEALRNFEANLWAACAEAMGKAPRPGSTRWAQAQDRWREALLREALATESNAANLAQRVERLYEQVGCPEDMLLMLTPSQAWSGTPATLDPAAVQRFLDRPQAASRRCAQGGRTADL